MTKVAIPAGPGRTIRQKRSRKTYGALIKTGFKLLKKREFESITIADIAEAAGYSVGAFYARFASKDEFFQAMVAHHLQARADAHEKLLSSVSHDVLIDELIEDIVKYYWRRRRFWRAVLMRSASDPGFWKPINKNAGLFVEQLTARIESDAKRELTESERENIQFAIHMVLGMVNNRIVNRPRPSFIGQDTFVDNLKRAFRLVSNFDALTGRGASQD